MPCFNPRAPCGARLFSIIRSNFADLFQSTRPMRGATDGGFSLGRHVKVSIHAPHAGRDAQYPRIRRSYAGFNPRAPCGARPPANPFYLAPCLFQSTRPMRGATVLGCRCGFCTGSFNPRAPCGARQQKRSRLPSSATHLWVFPSTNTIFSAPKTHAPPAA